MGILRKGNGPILIESNEVTFSQQIIKEKDLFKAGGRVRYKKGPRGTWTIDDEGVLTLNLKTDRPIPINEIAKLFKQMRK